MKYFFYKYLSLINNILFFLFLISIFLSILNFENFIIDIFNQLSFQILLFGITIVFIFIICKRFFISIISTLICILFGLQIFNSCEKCNSYLEDKTKQQQTISLMIFNINENNQLNNYSEFVELILNENPDVIQLQEISPKAFDKLQALEKFFPYNISLKEKKIDIMDSIILSKYPLKNTKLYKNFSLSTNIIIDKTEITIIAVHLFPPISENHYKLLIEQMESLKILIGQKANKIILIGDLNMTASSIRFTNFLKNTDLYTYISLKNPTFTWPAYLPFYLGIQLDHVLFTEHFKMFKKKTTNNFGSDHRALIVDLAF